MSIGPGPRQDPARFAIGGTARFSDHPHHPDPL
jgi:hypothetical protein